MLRHARAKKYEGWQADAGFIEEDKLDTKLQKPCKNPGDRGSL